MNLNPVSSVKVEHGIVKVTVLGAPDRPGIAAQLFSSLAREGINVGAISQTSSFRDGFIDISFTIGETKLESAVDVCRVAAIKLGADEVEFNPEVARITVSGTDIAQESGVAATVFGAFADLGANIEMIATTDSSVSCIVRETNADKVAERLRQKFDL
jgi:aspartate kinase